MKIKFLSIAFSAAVLFTACEKDDDNDSKDPSGTTTPTPSSPQVNIPGTSGSLIAINIASEIDVPFIGMQTQFIGSAVAVFWDGNTSQGIDAGMVTCEDAELTFRNSVYIFEPTSTTATLTFDNSIDWGVAGNNGVPAISDSYNDEVPEIGALTVAGEVNSSEDLSFGIDMTNSFTDISSADSVLYFVHGPSGSIQKSTANSTAVTFTKDELSTIGTGSGYAQAAAYNYQIKSYSGYDIAFVNEGVFTKTITIK